MFDKEIIDFGTVAQGSTGSISLKYLGEEPFDKFQMRTGCGCTQAEYNSETKEVTFSTTFRNTGEFGITPSYKNQYFIRIKATVI